VNLETSASPEQAVPQRVREVAHCIRGHLDEFCKMPLND